MISKPTLIMAPNSIMKCTMVIEEGRTRKLDRLKLTKQEKTNLVMMMNSCSRKRRLRKENNSWL